MAKKFLPPNMLKMAFPAILGDFCEIQKIFYQRSFLTRELKPVESSNVQISYLPQSLPEYVTSDSDLYQQHFRPSTSFVFQES